MLDQDRAAVGEFRYGMADPRVSGGGMAALIGVATAAAGTGAALRTEDVSCDRLQGFLAGRAFDAADPIAEYTRRSDVDGVVAHESELLALNASGLPQSLEIVYPRDGIVLSDYPLMLVEPAHRAAYDRVVEWLRSSEAQRMIADRTWRRPVDPATPRHEKLRADIGTALYFPDSQEVLDAWLFNAVSEVQDAADAWLTDYNEYRPHDSLGSLPPAVFRPRVFNQEVSTSDLST